MKTVREKLLENRIARLEKLMLKSESKRVNESRPTEGRMTVRDILAQYAGTDGTDDAELYDALSNTDTLTLMFDELGLNYDDMEDAHAMTDLLDNDCRVKVIGENSNGDWDVAVKVDGVGVFYLDWYNDEYDESKKRTTEIRCHKNCRRVNESLPSSGMTLGEILSMLMGTTSKNETLDDIRSMTDIHYQIADLAGFPENEEYGVRFIDRHWNDRCRVVINRGMGGGGSDEVNLSVAGITLSLDWLDEEAYESRKHSVRKCHR